MKNKKLILQIEEALNRKRLVELQKDKTVFVGTNFKVTERNIQDKKEKKSE